MLYKRGEVWWFKFRFAGRSIQESAKTDFERYCPTGGTETTERSRRGISWSEEEGSSANFQGRFGEVA